MTIVFDRSKYPPSSGIYIMKDREGVVIYVGKATSLRERLSQYFGTLNDPKTNALVSQIASIEFIVTKDPNEALILESNMIKNYQPKYNLVLKDAKHYAYLATTDEKFPRLVVARKNSSGKFRIKVRRFFGPFTEGSKRAVSARYLRRLFRIRICKTLPKKECLQYHIGNCDAPCINNISQEDYGKNVDALCAVLEGKEEARKIMDNLYARMKSASDSLDYEVASSIRDQIESLNIFFMRQRVEKVRRTDEDFLWFQRIGHTLHIQILKSRSGVIGKTEKYAIPIMAQAEPELVFCLQYYQSELPDLIYSNLVVSDLEALNLAFKAEAFKLPGKQKQKILDIASNSLESGEVAPEVRKLKDELGLKSNPLVIETFDISTLFGLETVASMVRFVNGKPDKSGYRKFKIKSFVGQDDFSSMKEVVTRRYSRLRSEGKSMPDLVLIDGGAGQLNAALEGMDASGVRLPVVSLAKKEEEIYVPNRMNTLRLSRSNSALKLLQNCRDEAHRFAITFHRKRRSKKFELEG